MFRIIFILSILMMATASAMAGVHLKCRTPENCFDNHNCPNMTVAILGVTDIECVDKDENQFQLSFYGWGLGLEFSNSKIGVHCPLASKKRIMSGIPLKVGGPKVSVTLIKGAQLGIGANLRGAFCSFTGINIGLGASATVGRFEINHIPKEEE